jgi:SAM-dependent methyltransferase
VRTGPGVHASATTSIRAEGSAVTDGFYGAVQARIHHEQFGDLAAAAAARLVRELQAAGRDTGTVVDLGCGSGILARRLVDAGYGVHGVDLSPDMVALARAGVPEATFERAAVLDAHLPPAVAVTAIGEVLNYATDRRAGIEALAAVSRRVHGALEPGGIFLFDVSTPGRLGPERARERVHDRGDWTLCMRAVERDDATLERRIAIFTRTAPGTYSRVDEHHVLHLYEPDDVVGAVEQAGFAVERLDGHGPAGASTPSTGWLVVLARA